MKNKIYLILILISTNAISQKLEIGFDFKYNTNLFNNQLEHGATANVIVDTSTNGTSILFPDANFSFIDEYDQEIFVTYDRTTVNTNFEIPIYLRYSTKKNFYFDAKFSSAKFQLNYYGYTRHSEQYYLDTYGTYEQMQSIYDVDSEFIPVDYDSSNMYTNSTAYQRYMENNIQNDQGSTVHYVEEFKLRSLYLGVGYKFSPQKALRPFIYTAFGYRSRVTNFGYSHFEFTGDTFWAGFEQRDVNSITRDIPSYGSQLFSVRFDAGIEKYRYHVGVTSEFIFGTASTSDNTKVINYKSPTSSIISIGFYLGADLFSHSFNTVDKKKDVYDSEYSTLTSKVYNNRKWSIGLLVKTPVANELSNYGNYSIDSFKDVIIGNLKDTSLSIYQDFSYQLLTFGEILKADWTPRFEASLRYNIVKRLDVELTYGFSRLQLDTKVREFKTVFKYYEYYDDVDATWYYYHSYDPDITKIQSSVYRADFFTFTWGFNLYYTILSNGYIDFRAFGGVAANTLNYQMGKLKPGINGNGYDIYQEVDDVYSNPYDYVDKTNGIGYSYNQNDIVLNDADPFSTMNAFYYYDDPNTAGAESGNIGSWKRLRNINDFYATVHFGLEAEINKFIFGASGDISLGNVDGFFIKNYYNINFTLGYLLFTKNKLEKK